MIINEEDYLMHYGILRKSGRYPWGSGENQEAINRSFIDTVDGLRKQGMSETDIARGFGITTTQLRAAKSIAKTERRQADILFAQRLHDKGMSNVAIGERMGINESSVRSLLAPGQKDKADALATTASMLKDQVDEKGFIQIGSGVEQQVGVSRTRLDTAVAVLQEQGYTVHTIQENQLGTTNKTYVKVLAPPGTSYVDVVKNKDQIHMIQEVSNDGGRTFLGIKEPVSVDSSRLAIRYAEDGGTKADGVIYIRRGVDDLSLGASSYAQVRIAVDGTHFIKGMAMYKDDLPHGVDLEFNTNKSNTGNKLDALKPMKRDETTGKIDKDNPFGAVISRQSGVMNIVNEEGDWGEWSRSLSSQMLSKQSSKLIKSQLDMTYEQRRTEFDDIMRLTNPAVKKKLLQSFSDEADGAAVHLKAAALPHQGSHVILPVKSMKETEIYAPNFNNGDQVVLIRFPHGGIFEIPELTVNNRQPEARKLLGTKAKDAVGINSKVAERLSGADFDGDTVLVIPNNNRQIRTAPALEGLKNFDPKHSFPLPPGQKFKGNKQQLMGDVSNLITDMTIKGASSDELARAVRHSMVVIDAEKHDLDHKASAQANGIAALKTKYQGGPRAGASTIVSRKKSEERVPKFKPRPAKDGGPIDKATGKKVYVQTGESYIDKKGKLIVKKVPVRKLELTDDAHTLSSGTQKEKLYADHSNRLKSLANEARKEMVNTKTIPYSPSAKKAYANEVTILNSKLNIALRNQPLERQAQLLANRVVAAKRQSNPSMDYAELKKIKGQALTEARIRTGAKKHKIVLTPNEWEAIQAGAISNHKLTQILDNADLDVVKQLATPKNRPLMTATKVTRARAMFDAGFTQSEIAQQLGVSLTTLKTSISEGG